MTDSQVGGQLQGISLDSFLQMAQMERTTCTLIVRAGQKVGQVYLVKGTLIDAETGDMRGRQAACEIISWPNAVIEIENSCDRKENSINTPLMEILMAGMKLRDDRVSPPETERGEAAPPKAKATAQGDGRKASASKPAGKRPPKAPGAKKPAAARPTETPRAQKPAAARPTDAPRAQKPAAADRGRTPPPPKPAPRKPAPAPRPAESETPKSATAAKAAKPPPKRLVLAAGGALLVVLAAVLYLFVFSGSGGESYESLTARVAQETRLSAKIEIIEAYIAGREPDEETLKAEEDLRTLRNLAEEEAFDAVLLEVSQLPFDDNYRQAATELFNRYLTAYPQARFASEARQHIANIDERLETEAFKEVVSAESQGGAKALAAYTRYLERFPEGQNHEIVRRKLSAMEGAAFAALKEEVDACQQEGSWDKCISRCDRFVEIYRDSRHMEQVIAMKIRLKGEQLMHELKAAAEKKEDPRAAREVYAAFLADHPDSIHGERVAAEMAAIDARIDARDRWMRIAAGSRDESRGIDARITQLEEYLSRNPGGEYEEKARDLMAELAAEKKDAARKQLAAQRERERLERIRLGEEARQRQLEARRRLERQVADTLRQTEGRFVSNGDGTVSDTRTGLTWALLDSQLDLGKCLTYASAANYVEGLRTGGFGDWRIPTAGELAGIYKSPPYFPSSGAGWYWSSETYVKGYHQIANVVTSRQEKVFNIKQERQTRCGSVRAVRP